MAFRQKWVKILHSVENFLQNKKNFLRTNIEIKIKLANMLYGGIGNILFIKILLMGLIRFIVHLLLKYKFCISFLHLFQ